MKKTYKIILYIWICIIPFYGCKKTFLDAKPSTTIVSPSSLNDLQGLMENAPILNSCTPALSLMASDDYTFIDYISWQSAYTAPERNSYIWAKDIFEGQTEVWDWRTGYAAIFYCNNVLETLKSIEVNATNLNQYKTIKGWALFMRAYALYDLTRNFCQTFKTETASTDLGMPIRLKPGIDEISQRATLKQTYDQILSDLEQSKSLLDISIPTNNNRPSKVAAYSLFARIYLSMNNYDKAEKYADSSLAIKNKLINYNNLSTSSETPFSLNNDEIIFNTSAVNNSYVITFTFSGNTQVTVNPDLVKLYSQDDLRLKIFFALNPNNNLYVKQGYYFGILPFTGLATDEMFLIKAECLARRNETDQGLIWLNNLLRMRYTTGKYVSISELSQQEAINLILIERRKELVWRTLRWSDLKRLNAIGAGITLTRILNNVTYTLPPNDPRYVFPIPDDEIALSGIQQNIR